MANFVPANQLTVAQAHQEFTKLVDQISAKFTELDSGEFGAVGTPAFDAKMHDLAVLFARFRLIYTDHLSSNIRLVTSFG